jgi:hypothetical protein
LTAVRQVFRGGPQAVSERSTAKTVPGTERMKNTPIHVCAKTAFLVGLQQKVGELGLSMASRPSVI